MRRLFFIATKGCHFRKLGRQPKFYGWPAFGSMEGNMDIGDNCMIGRGIFLSAGRDAEIKLGSNVSLNTGCHLVSIASIEIGDGTRIGEYVTIRDQNHARSDDGQVVSGGFESEPIRIGKHCWIGRGVFIGAGVSIGDYAVVAANAAVTKDVAPHSLVGGVPARLIRQNEPPKESKI